MLNASIENLIANQQELNAQNAEKVQSLKENLNVEPCSMVVISIQIVILLCGMNQPVKNVQNVAHY